MHYEIRNIPAARAATVIALAVGLPYGLLILVASFFLTARPTETTTFVQFAAQLFVPPLVAWFVVMATTWVTVGVACFVYNLVASKVGGVVLEMRGLDDDQS